jgi:hypothetical protein
MERLTRNASVAFVGVAVVVLTALPAGAQSRGASALQAPKLQARALSGSITGTVMDESGAALPGAMVSVLGVTLASTVTDERGQFTLNQLPLGDYLLRAHMLGFAASTGSMIRVGSSTPFQRVQLRRLEGTIADATGEAPVKARPIIAAGFELPRGGDGTSSTASSTEHPHDDAAWWTRHLKRSILKDSSQILVLNDDEPLPSNGSLFGRAMGSAASVASSLFTDFPFSGEVNFLTTGSVAPGAALLSTTALPRGVAYLALAAPAPGGDWSFRGAMSQGDLSSWNVAGAYTSKPSGGSHRYDFGVSYSTQEYLGGNPAALAAVRDGSRNVGELYAFDDWEISPRLSVDYGARYAHYDYLQQSGLLSPKFGVSVEALPETIVRMAIEQRMVAPGAEEFLTTSSPGPWLPPERTFAPLGEGDLRAERGRFFDIGVDRQLGDAVVVGVSRYHQSVDDQLVTIFGLSMPGGPQSVGHYYVAGAGAVEADGWQVRLNTAASARLQASVQYSRTDARWIGRGAQDLLATAAASAIRPDAEELHDLTTSLTADIRETATRVFVICKVNNGFVNPGLAPAAGSRGAMTDARFGIQVNQALPVAFAGTKWEVLVGLRNLFRDPSDPASVYDELLVVRPPKRLVGGFLVRF